jgi:hypothetical protein
MKLKRGLHLSFNVFLRHIYMKMKLGLNLSLNVFLWHIVTRIHSKIGPVLVSVSYICDVGIYTVRDIFTLQMEKESGFFHDFICLLTFVYLLYKFNVQKFVMN